MGFEWLIGGLIAGLVAVAVGFAPRRTEVVGTDLRVHSWLKTFHFDLRQVSSTESIDRNDFSWKNTIRLFGVGWPLKPYGWFWNRQRGIVLAMVSDRRNIVLLNLRDRRVLVSMENAAKSSG